MSGAGENKAKLFSKLRGQGGGYKTKVSGTGKGTGTNPPAEGGSETSGNRASKQKTRDGEGSVDVDLGATVAELAPQKKELRVEKTGPESALVAGTLDSVPGGSSDIDAVGAGSGSRKEEIAPCNVVIPGNTPDAEPVDNVKVLEIGAGSPAKDSAPGNAVVQGNAPDARSGPGGSAGEIAPGTVKLRDDNTPRASSVKKVVGKVGTKTLIELAKMAAEIPDEKDWDRMRGSSRPDNLWHRTALWA